MNATDRREIKLQARREGKAVYYRERARRFRADAAAARARGAEAAADKLDDKAQSDEDTASRLQNG